MLNRIRRRRSGDAHPAFAASFLTLERGTPVVDRFGRPAGDVRRVLLHSNGMFDGLIVRTRAGSRFVDAPEVRRVSRGTVVLGITMDEVERPTGDRQGRDGVPGAGHGRTALTEADRDAVIDALKQAYVADELTTDELADRVVLAHEAASLDDLDAALDI